MPVYLTPPPGNPLTRILAAIVAALVMAGAFMLGIVALAIVAGLAVILGAVVWFRTWRLRRALRRRGSESKQSGRDAEIIEAEYTVVSRGRDRE